MTVKKNLLSGFIILLPITISVLLVIFVIDLLTAPFLDTVEHLVELFGRSYSYDLLQNRTFLVVISRIIILVCIFLFTLLLGFLANKIFFHWIVKTMNHVMMKIPLINSIYRTCRDVISALFSGDKKFVSRIVAVPFPNKLSYTFGLVTGNAPDEVQEVNQKLCPDDVIKSVFVPTSPHPTSGFLLLTKDKYIRPVDISLENVFKYLISCGAFVPPSDEKSDDESANNEVEKTELKLSRDGQKEDN